MKRLAAASLLAVLFVLVTAAVQADDGWSVSMFREPPKRRARRPAPRASAPPVQWLERALAAETARKPRRRVPVSYGEHEVPVLSSRTR